MWKGVEDGPHDILERCLPEPNLSVRGLVMNYPNYGPSSNDMRRILGFKPLPNEPIYRLYIHLSNENDDVTSKDYPGEMTLKTLKSEMDIAVHMSNVEKVELVHILFPGQDEEVRHVLDELPPEESSIKITLKPKVGSIWIWDHEDIRIRVVSNTGDDYVTVKVERTDGVPFEPNLPYVEFSLPHFWRSVTPAEVDPDTLAEMVKHVDNRDDE
jgi:hypothetical protein